MEDYNPAYYDALERAIEEEIAKDEATIEDVDTSLRLSPCEDCPLMGFPIEKAIREQYMARAASGEPGLTLAVRYISEDGQSSKTIILGRHNKNSIGDKRRQKIYADAAQRTIECTGPEKVSKLLGLLGTKKICPALEHLDW